MAYRQLKKTALMTLNRRLLLGITPVLLILLAVGIYAIVLFQRFFTSPQIVYLGAQMDFVALNVVIPERNQLIAVQKIFTGVEIFKALAIVGLGVYLIARKRRSSHSWDHIDMVDESDHRHVDG